MGGDAVSIMCLRSEAVTGSEDWTCLGSIRGES
jgi:hypothetical protein